MFVSGFCVHPNVLVRVISSTSRGKHDAWLPLFSSVERSTRGVAALVRYTGQNWASRRHSRDADDLLVAEVFSNLLERRGGNLYKIPALFDRPLVKNSIPGESI